MFRKSCNGIALASGGTIESNQIQLFRDCCKAQLRILLHMSFYGNMCSVFPSSNRRLQTMASLSAANVFERKEIKHFYGKIKNGGSFVRLY